MPEKALPAPSPSSERPATLSDARTSQLATVCEEVRRSPLPVFAADALLAFLLYRAGIAEGALAWLGISSAVSLGRAAVARRLLQRLDHGTPQGFRTLMGWFFLVGLTRSWPIAAAFGHASNELHYAVTMVMLGMAAGGVGTVVGVVPLYLAWSTPVALALMSVWLLRGNVEGAWIALLLLLMFTLLTLYVRDFGRILGKEVRLRQALEEQRDLARHEGRRAEEAVVARTRFFETASHDLRQPLGVLRWYGDTVAVYARQLDHEKLLDVAAGIERALDRIQPLVNKYLDIARLDADSVPVVLQPVALPALLESVRKAFAHEAGERGLDLQVRIDGAADSMVAMSDESLLRSILDNLAGNAIKFTHEGRVVLAASLVPGTSRVCIAVSDTGIGIPEPDREAVFEDFRQLANPGRTGGNGVGLGLAIARRQARLLRCELRISPNQPRGTTFCFELPLLPAATAPVAAAGTAGPMATLPMHLLRVLVVDDEADVLMSLRSMLEAAGITVETASSLREAQRLLDAGFGATVLVVDYRLHGGIDGVHLVQLLAEAGHRIPALIVTGETAPAELARLASAGWPVLHKPVGGAALIAAMLDLVGTDSKA
jgi:signal transduction histidine kinase